MDIDIVQKQDGHTLTEGEKALYAALVNDMLEWCTDDILRGGTTGAR